MNDYAYLECSHCNFNSIVYNDGNDNTATCNYCGLEAKLTQYEDIADGDIIIEIIECELENANRHSWDMLPRELYNKIKKDDNNVELAKVIAKTFYHSI